MDNNAQPTWAGRADVKRTHKLPASNGPIMAALIITTGVICLIAMMWGSIITKWNALMSFSLEAWLDQRYWLPALPMAIIAILGVIFAVVHLTMAADQQAVRTQMNRH